MFKTEYDFELPRGYIDKEGTLHKKGKMRLATAADEILPMNDPKVKQNQSYLTIILLARVIEELGTVHAVDTKVVEKLFTADLAYLQDMYQRINSVETPTLTTVCPKCGEKYGAPLDFFQLNFSDHQ
jgi:phage FluMu protein gp41